MTAPEFNSISAHVRTVTGGCNVMAPQCHVTIKLKINKIFFDLPRLTFTIENKAKTVFFPRFLDYVIYQWSNSNAQIAHFTNRFIFIFCQLVICDTVSLTFSWKYLSFLTVLWASNGNKRCFSNDEDVCWFMSVSCCINHLCHIAAKLSMSCKILDCYLRLNDTYHSSALKYSDWACINL